MRPAQHGQFIIASLPPSRHLCQLTAAKSSQDNSTQPTRMGTSRRGWASKQMGRVQSSGWGFPIFTPLAATATELQAKEAREGGGSGQDGWQEMAAARASHFHTYPAALLPFPASSAQNSAAAAGVKMG